MRKHAFSFNKSRAHNTLNQIDNTFIFFSQKKCKSVVYPVFLSQTTEKEKVT